MRRSGAGLDSDAFDEASVRNAALRAVARLEGCAVLREPACSRFAQDFGRGGARYAQGRGRWRARQESNL